MFKKEDGGDSVETVIGPSVQVDGNFVANGDIIVEGVVAGNIRTEKNLRVGENAKIFANVAAANALVAGEIQGNVKVKENLELTSTAKIFGDVKAKILNVNPGATIQGKCSTGDDKKTKLDKIGERPTEKEEPKLKKEKLKE